MFANDSRKRSSVWISIALLALTFFLVSGRTATAQVTSSSLGEHSPTFVGPAATGCNGPGCSLLSGPYSAPAQTPGSSGGSTSSNSGSLSPKVKSVPSPRQNGPDPVPPTVSCAPMGPGCDEIDSSSGGAYGVKGLNAVDSGTVLTNEGSPFTDIEPADQGLCAGNGYVVETNNTGEIMIFNTALQRRSGVIALADIMGLLGRGWSSGGDPSCYYDSDNGGHWFFTEIVSASSVASGGAFAGCYAPVANTCYEGIAVTVGSDPFGPYNVYFLNSNYNPSEPGSPFLLNDFAKIGATRDAFLVFYDEFPQDPNTPGINGSFFNGAQEFAFNKTALEEGWPTTRHEGRPNPNFTVAIENMGLLPTPDGTCSAASPTCWYQVIPAQAPDPTQFDNHHEGTGFMIGSLDFVGSGDTRFAVFDWTGLEHLNSRDCESCDRIHFGGQLFSGGLFYYGEGFLGAQKKGRIPLGDECGAAGLSVSPATGVPASASCPEGGIATNGDGVTQVAQAQGQLWTAISTAVGQKYWWELVPEVHQGALYWVVGTDSFDRNKVFTLTNQEYVSPEHEDIEFPAIGAGGSASEDGGNNGAMMTFTLSGQGGKHEDHDGGFYPSTAYGRLSSTSNGLLGSEINVADLGEAPQDGFSEYQFYPTAALRPRWGDYSWAIFLPWSGGRIYFATNYIQYRNCDADDFTLTVGTCNGTRDGFANWGTSVNFVVP